MLCELLVDGLDGEHDNPAYGEHRHDPDDPKMAEIQVKEACHGKPGRPKWKRVIDEWK